jgi:sec-independent protein translocase protein TatC
MLAVPLWILYELGIIVSMMITKPRPEAGTDYQPMSESDMDAEFDRIEADQSESGSRETK